VLPFDFPTGSATVEVIPDTAKLSVNTAPPDELKNLMLALGVDDGQAAAIVAGILDWRSTSPGGSFTSFDQHYLSIAPTFRARHASLQEIEELLLVQGITPEYVEKARKHGFQNLTLDKLIALKNADVL
jgi:type II secretory pathway component PulK